MDLINIRNCKPEMLNDLSEMADHQGDFRMLQQ